MIIAPAVIRTDEYEYIQLQGRKIGILLYFSNRSLAKVITRTLFAVATPMHMIAPINAGTPKLFPL